MNVSSYININSVHFVDFRQEKLQMFFEVVSRLVVATQLNAAPANKSK
jgi:hypothetical protein